MSFLSPDRSTSNAVVHIIISGLDFLTLCLTFPALLLAPPHPPYFPETPFPHIILKQINESFIYSNDFSTAYYDCCA